MTKPVICPLKKELPVNSSVLLLLSLQWFLNHCKLNICYFRGFIWKKTSNNEPFWSLKATSILDIAIAIDKVLPFINGRLSFHLWNNSRVNMFFIRSDYMKLYLLYKIEMFLFIPVYKSTIDMLLNKTALLCSDIFWTVTEHAKLLFPVGSRQQPQGTWGVWELPLSTLCHTIGLGGGGGHGTGLSNWATPYYTPWLESGGCMP